MIKDDKVLCDFCKLDFTSDKRTQLYFVGFDVATTYKHHFYDVCSECRHKTREKIDEILMELIKRI